MQQLILLQRSRKYFRLVSCLLIFLSASFANAIILNNPYTHHDLKDHVFYSAFSVKPQTLDPAKSYNAADWLFLGNVYESLLQYHYLKRPYELIPNLAEKLPSPIFLDADEKILPSNTAAKNIVYTVYRLHIKKGIYYQPHPAFAKNEKGDFLYHHLNAYDLFLKNTIQSFSDNSTREVTADDFVYQIKRLADPRNSSPIYGFMETRIEGFKHFSHLAAEQQKTLPPDQWFDLRNLPLEGAKTIDRYTFEIKIHGEYRPFIYWLAMPFFSPLPWEAECFYQQSVLKQKNITLDTYPVGTGAFMIGDNNPNKKITLIKNPHYHPDFYPTEGAPGDRERGLLKNAGKRLPLIDTFVFTLEKETVPRWNKFLQGYYDRSLISDDNFQQVVQLTEIGPQLSPFMKEKGIRLTTNVDMSHFFMGFNMYDPVVGGYTTKARKLRQAINIAIHIENFIALFRNGRGMVAHDPLPPALFGKPTAENNMNPYAYHWNHGPVRQSIHDAKQLLTQAGYRNGIDPKTKKPLVLHYTVITVGGPDDAARLGWYKKQFANIGIQLNIQTVQLSRYEELMKNGDTQLFDMGWDADYPDPENFLFIFHSQNGKVKYDGENMMNYENKHYDALFEIMRNLPNNALRKKIIHEMIALLQNDTPSTSGFYPETFFLSHEWVNPSKLSDVNLNTLKYVAIDPVKRLQYWNAHNHAILWPLILFLISFIILLLPAIIAYRRQQNQLAPRE